MLLLIMITTQPNATRETAVLATIELDYASEFAGQRGELYYRDGDIWCILPSGEHQATNTGCPSEDQAIETIDAAWRSGWDLQWIEN